MSGSPRCAGSFLGTRASDALVHRSVKVRKGVFERLTERGREKVSRVADAACVQACLRGVACWAVCACCA
eukprot:6181351-Pleurochrysis_carterae.AAC.7